MRLADRRRPVEVPHATEADYDLRRVAIPALRPDATEIDAIAAHLAQRAFSLPAPRPCHAGDLGHPLLDEMQQRCGPIWIQTHSGLVRRPIGRRVPFFRLLDAVDAIDVLAANAVPFVKAGHASDLPTAVFERMVPDAAIRQ